MTLLSLTVVVAVAAAVRSTWSPCGVSMLSTLTPLSERSRGHRYPVTAAWFVAGACVGGACLGGVLAAMAALAGLADDRARAAAVVVGSVLTAMSDLRVARLALPRTRRQVDEGWIDRYRAWVYAGGFGWQIGAGVTTYITTAAVYLTVLAAAMTGRPTAAFMVGCGFGAARGLSLLLGARLGTPAAVRQFHARFDRLSPASVALAVAAQVAVLAGALRLADRAAALPLAAAAVAVWLSVAWWVHRPAAVAVRRRELVGQPAD